jgi:imidazolonepropionase-like amidohydrolase
LGATLENASRLHDAGVTIAIGINTHNIRLAAQHAGNAVANGLPHSAGIAALTVNPAIIFGMNEKVGTIERGKRADLVVWSGDPLEVTEAAEVVLINGVVTSMESRQTKLRDRYMNRDPKLPVAYSQ